MTYNQIVRHTTMNLIIEEDTKIIISNKINNNNKEEVIEISLKISQIMITCKEVMEIEKEVRIFRIGSKWDKKEGIEMIIKNNSITGIIIIIKIIREEIIEISKAKIKGLRVIDKNNLTEENLLEILEEMIIKINIKDIIILIKGIKIEINPKIKITIKIEAEVQ